MKANPRQQAEALHDTMARLYKAGFTLIPMGGDDGKKPLITGWKGRRLPFDAVIKRMQNARSQTYAVRLEGLLVVDIDTDNEATRAIFDSRFKPSTVQVGTARGAHHYYRHEGLVPKAIRGDGIAIDFKAGGSQYVLGPGSIRPDGTVYGPLDGALGFSVLPSFRDALPPASKPKVQVGERNTTLHKKAAEYAPFADDFDGLLADLVALRDIEFDDAASVSDDEILKVAQWAWRLRTENRLWSKRNSAVQINRLVLDCLLPVEYGTEAVALYSLIQSEHGHKPGKVFAVVPDALIAAGRIKMSRSALYRARRLLIDKHLIALVRKGFTRGDQHHPDLFRLQSPVIAASLREQGGGVYSLTYVTNVEHGEAA